MKRANSTFLFCISRAVIFDPPYYYINDTKIEKILQIILYFVEEGIVL